MPVNENVNGTDIKKCPDCGCDMVKTSDNDPLVMEYTKYKSSGCGNEHKVYEEEQAGRKPCFITRRIYLWNFMLITL